jgi:hypothetical protein
VQDYESTNINPFVAASRPRNASQNFPLVMITGVRISASRCYFIDKTLSSGMKELNLKVLGVKRPGVNGKQAQSSQVPSIVAYGRAECGVRWCF